MGFTTILSYKLHYFHTINLLTMDNTIKPSRRLFLTYLSDGFSSLMPYRAAVGLLRARIMVISSESSGSGSSSVDGSVVALMIRASSAGLNATILAAVAGFIFKLILDEKAKKVLLTCNVIKFEKVG